MNIKNVDYAIYVGGNGGSDTCVIDAIKFSGTTITRVATKSLDGIVVEHAVCTVNANGNQYALYGGGHSNYNSVITCKASVSVIDFTDGSIINITTADSALSKARTELAAAKVTVNGLDYVVFGGGSVDNSTPSDVIDVVRFDGTDITNVATGQLSVARCKLSATTINVDGRDIVMFSGGCTGGISSNTSTYVSNAIDFIYFDGTKIVSYGTATLAVARWYNVAATLKRTVDGKQYGLVMCGYNGVSLQQAI